MPYCPWISCIKYLFPEGMFATLAAGFVLVGVVFLNKRRKEVLVRVRVTYLYGEYFLEGDAHSP